MFSFGLMVLVAISLIAVKMMVAQKRKEKEMILPVDVNDENRWEFHFNILGVIAMTGIVLSFCQKFLS